MALIMESNSRAFLVMLVVFCHIVSSIIASSENTTISTNATTVSNFEETNSTILPSEISKDQQLQQQLLPAKIRKDQEIQQLTDATTVSNFNETNSTSATANISKDQQQQVSKKVLTNTSKLTKDASGAAVSSREFTSLVSAQTQQEAVVAKNSATAPKENVHLPFNCLRPSARCVGNGSVCSKETGRCLCSEGRQGYDCSLLTESVVTACDPPCLNGGSCYSQQINDSTNTYLCFCKEAFYGNSCEQERVYHKCNPDSMEIHVAPIVDSTAKFTGSVFIKGHEDNTRCVFTADKKYQSSLTNKIPFTDCGKADNNTDSNTGTTLLSWKVVVRYDEVLLATDQELTFTCYLSEPGKNAYVWRAWMISNENMINSQLPSRSVASDVQPVHMSLETLDGKPVVGPQQLGTSLQLRYTLNGGNVYQSFRVEKITASNALTGAKRHAINLVTSGCVTNDAMNVKKIVQSLGRQDSTQVLMKFKVFKLRYSNQLVFENVIKACRNSSDCQMTECERIDSNRRKRSLQVTDVDSRLVLPSGVDTDTSVYNKANASLTVWYLDDDRNTNDSECSRVFRRWRQGEQSGSQLQYVILIVVAAALIVAIVIIVSLVVIFMCSKFLRRKQ